MQIHLTITDDGNGIQVNSGSSEIKPSTSRPDVLPESWWVEARQVYANHRAAVERDDLAVVRATENWIGGMLKAAVLVYPDLDHTVLMTEIMISAPSSGSAWGGVGKLVKEPPLPSSANEGAGLMAEPVIRTGEPERRTILGGDLSELDDDEWESFDENEAPIPESI